MNECLRCGRSGSNGLFCNQCHSSLIYRFRETWHQSECPTIFQLKTPTLVHDATMPQFVKRSPLSFTLRRLVVVLIVMLIIIFLADTVLVVLVVSKHQPLSTYIGSVPLAGFPPSTHIKGAFLPGQSYGNPKNDSSESSPTTLPVFDISPDDLAFSAIQGQSDPPEQAVAIANIGAGELSWHIQSKSNGSSWLVMNVMAGSLKSDQVTQIALHVSCTTLLVGTYRASVFTSALDSSGNLSAGSPQTFSVELDILPAYNLNQNKQSG